MEIILAEPRGFCAGVKRAVDILAITLKKYRNKRKVYVLHEIVHNKYIVEDFKRQGVIFVNSIRDIKDNRGILIFSAHGVSKNIEDKAKRKGIQVIDATCPLVSKVHKEAKRYEDSGKELILIGHKNHPEVKGIRGRVNNPIVLVQTLQNVRDLKVKNPDNLSYVTQTTLSTDDTREIITALKLRFPNITGPNLKDICYATQNRQNAVKKLTEIVDIVLIIGSKNSSNSNRLLDLCTARGKRAYLIDNYSYMDKSWLQGIEKIGITAGASAPDILVDELINHLKINVNTKVSVMSDGVTENVQFKIPHLV
ncbi:4-hydroxy-3-methylbut-2-enyl diphosphate reductase [Wolbachia endosymbiont of Brugia malayi]|uniref:4-hydroxy-3-methylbut-2-enyl diphosphate reductase n=1 Tax=Wolbachia sp. subsp. Brugia malayi (strain TRS) TaxID=292805 RepID=ISPH_WOLTR|nr:MULTISPECIES: 4-hydroxy-3-methylbut-2-enyl diphosphate reductase [unclassified Wolbachia]Q5GTN6.1 RecName: Full=4-hydroxy-3-methylbut-2-enyl diphosphate reductase; Short=HMBPP reductase [Wolbachia endosymbiont strain TRS of Brugia malayi]AAW70638.1 4-Hydroxy-3-methylbut-2-enyl diphosphate reductase, IspH [Wolbachia endosymbiont strain TRS of Brugia malayi]QCB61625.1 4-hydroxy-3-methylbut-2-enyl diphosphate reductase [Wolbachia endosymbiont of Brugia malayi]QIT35842.1 4-hydroxy-3-methylbut-2-